MVEKVIFCQFPFGNIKPIDVYIVVFVNRRKSDRKKTPGKLQFNRSIGVVIKRATGQFLPMKR